MANVYDISHEGQTAFICGSAPCLLEEFEEAIEQRPNAVTIGINEAVSGIFCDFLVSYHCEKFKEFKAISVFPEIKTMTGKGYRTPEEEAQIDYRFEDINIGATSAGDAIQIAQKMGFSEIIMIGCPMNGGDGYFSDTSDESDGCPRFGAASAVEGRHAEMVQSHKSTLKAIAEIVDLSMVRSMSGYTSEVFGKPEWR